MNKILINTHKKENIELLKVRDYFFDKARFLNRVKLALLVFPIIVAFVLAFFAKNNVINTYKDIIVGAITVVSFIPIFFINRSISNNVMISNTFREEYDVRVLEMSRNDYAYDYSVLEKYKDIKKKEIYVNPKNNFGKKYEYWYEEIFSDNLINNTICCQMDNIIYTYFAYKSYTKVLIVGLISSLVIAAGLALGASIIFNDYISFFLCALVAIIPLLQMFVESIITCHELVQNNIHLKDLIMGHDKFSSEQVRMLQDTIITNRDNSLFISKRIRKRFLKDGSPYYKDLAEIKEKFLNKGVVSIPSSSDDIEVLSLNGEKTTTLTEVQNKLTSMLSNVIKAFNKTNTQYFVDGGTLIGAIREKGKYIFWDDDVDLGILTTDIEGLISVLKKELPEYEFQTYENEEFYSPRLSSLRIREKNTSSIICEKDSPLYSKYNYRGLFIDVYVYHPIYKSIRCDARYRKNHFHKLNKKIREIEYKCLLDENKYLPKFKKLKAIYLRRVDKYHNIAKNTNYYSYLPTYIDNLKKPGPYISKSDLLGDGLKLAPFAGLEVSIPNNPESLLKAIYGPKWNESPYKTIDELKQEYKEDWTFKKGFSTTCLKHISYID